jgi:hypothetical protein
VYYLKAHLLPFYTELDFSCWLGEDTKEMECIHNFVAWEIPANGGELIAPKRITPKKKLNFAAILEKQKREQESKVMGLHLH